MNRLNNTEPKTEPCGTPFSRSSQSLAELPTRTRCFLPDKYDQMSTQDFPQTAYAGHEELVGQAVERLTYVHEFRSNMLMFLQRPLPIIS